MISADQLWFRLLEQWKLRRMGDTGPTLPFLLGAACVLGVEGDVSDIGRLGELLFSFQLSNTHFIRIAECYKLHEPVAALYERHATMDIVELVRLPRGKGDSSLFVSQAYRHKQDLHSACEALRKHVETAIEKKLYSFNNGRYGAYNDKEIKYIRDIAEE